MDPDLYRSTLAWWLLALLAFVVAAATVEGVVLQRRTGHYDWHAYFATLGDAIGRRLIEATGVSIVAPLFVWAAAHRVQTIPLDGVTA